MGRSADFEGVISPKSMSGSFNTGQLIKHGLSKIRNPELLNIQKNNKSPMIEKLIGMNNKLKTKKLTVFGQTKKN